jgi:POT family proton-dependent oligopeptide transporter
LNLFATEFCERFSYYGMRAILVFYLYDKVSDGGLGLSETDSMVIMSAFGSLVYLSSIAGGWLADRVLGPYRSILSGGIGIGAGHLVLGLPLGVSGTVLAMLLIIAGTGLLKPNVSVMVGMLYAKDDPRRQAGFSLLYLAINIGSLLSPLIVGSVSARAGYNVAFTIPAVFMGAGIFIYVALSKRTLAGLGRSPIDPLNPARSRQTRALLTAAGAAVLAAGGGLTYLHSREVVAISDSIPFACALTAAVIFVFIFQDKRVAAAERRRMVAYIPLFLAATIFFAISEQQSSTLAVVAKQCVDSNVGGFHIEASWFSSVNPLGIALLSPVFAALWTRLRGRQPSMVVKMALGLATAGAGFALLAAAFWSLPGSARLNPLWLVGALLVVTVGELLLSPTGLAASTLFAPEIHLSKVMGLWFLSSALGQAVNTITVQFFQPARAAGFFAAYAAVAVAFAVAMLALRGRLAGLMGGIG